MRYQNNLLAQQYDDLHEKHMKCKKYVDPFSSSDIEYAKNIENELSLFEEDNFCESMVFDNEKDELSIQQVIRNNFKKLNRPADFHFENGFLRRPVLNDEENSLVAHLLTPRRDGFTGRVRVHNWSSVDPGSKVTILFEKAV